jgi:hypothetical protein
MTGWGMSAHEQHLMISSKIHGLFGYALIAAGVMRLIEICFVLNDNATPHGVVRIFQHLPPYVSYSQDILDHADETAPCSWRVCVSQFSSDQADHSERSSCPQQMKRCTTPTSESDPCVVHSEC